MKTKNVLYRQLMTRQKSGEGKIHLRDHVNIIIPTRAQVSRRLFISPKSLPELLINKVNKIV